MNAKQGTRPIATTPAELVKLFSAGLNAGDVEALLYYYDEEGSFSPEEGVVVTGKEAIGEALRGFLALKPAVTNEVKWVQQVGGYALVINDSVTKIRQPDGKVVTMTGRSTDVARRGEDGGWRFYIDCVWGGNANNSGT